MDLPEILRAVFKGHVLTAVGSATLAAGTKVVTNSQVTADSIILLTGQDANVTGFVRVSTRTAGTSFTILSSVAGDTGVVGYMILSPEG